MLRIPQKCQTRPKPIAHPRIKTTTTAHAGSKEQFEVGFGLFKLNWWQAKANKLSCRYELENMECAI